MGGDISLATVVGPHGLKGEVRVKLHTDSAENLRAYALLRTTDGRALRLNNARDSRSGEAILAFAEIGNRDAAESLRGKDLLVARKALPEIATNEFYHAELIGLRADDSESRTIGHVRAVHNFGAGDVIEIGRPDGDSVLLAFTSENVPLVDLAGGRIVVAVRKEIEAGKKGNVE